MPNTHLYLFDKNWTAIGTAASLQYTGFGTVGNLEKELAEGDYYLYVIHGNSKKMVAPISLNFYWMKQKAGITGGDQWD